MSNPGVPIVALSGVEDDEGLVAIDVDLGQRRAERAVLQAVVAGQEGGHLLLRPGLGPSPGDQAHIHAVDELQAKENRDDAPGWGVSGASSRVRRSTSTVVVLAGLLDADLPTRA